MEQIHSIEETKRKTTHSLLRINNDTIFELHVTAFILNNEINSSTQLSYAEAVSVLQLTQQLLCLAYHDYYD